LKKKKKNNICQYSGVQAENFITKEEDENYEIHELEMQMTKDEK
jgi:hypothetical protein